MNTKTEESVALTPMDGGKRVRIPAKRFAAAIIRNPYYSSAAKLFGSHAAALVKALPMLRPYPGMVLADVTESEWMPLVDAAEQLSGMDVGAQRELAALDPPLTPAEKEEWHEAWEKLKHEPAPRDAQHAVERVVNLLEAAGSSLHHRLRAEWGLPLEGDATARTAEFEDSQAMSIDHSTFEAPSADDLESVREGSYVKVCCGGERFWSIVTRREGDRIWATVANDLAFTNIHGLRYMDAIQYETRHAFSTSPPQ